MGGQWELLPTLKLYTDVTTLPEKGKISPQSLQRETQGGQVSEEGNGIVRTRNLQRKQVWLRYMENC